MHIGTNTTHDNAWTLVLYMYAMHVCVCVCGILFLFIFFILCFFRDRFSYFNIAEHGQWCWTTTTKTHMETTHNRLNGTLGERVFHKWKHWVKKTNSNLYTYLIWFVVHGIMAINLFHLKYAHITQYSVLHTNARTKIHFAGQVSQQFELHYTSYQFKTTKKKTPSVSFDRYSIFRLWCTSNIA